MGSARHRILRARLAAWLLCGGLLACGGGSRDGESGSLDSPPVAGKLEQAPSIVIVTIDTLRADHLHAYGYHRQTSPQLDALAAEGVLFEQAFATMATTLPSHVSLFSGVFAHQHGITANRFRGRPFDGDTGSRLQSVAELLRDDGYTTAAFVSAAPVKRVTGIAAGFDVFEEPRGYEVKGPRTTDHAIAWLEDAPRQPFLLWVHLWDPHEPNRPSGEWVAKFPSDEGLERVIEQRAIDPDRLASEFAPPALRRFLDPRPDAGEANEANEGYEANDADDAGDADDEAALAVEEGAAWDEASPESRRRDDPPPRVDREAVRGMLNRYDADVAAADAQVGRLVEALRSLSLLDRSIVVVTADHGQSLGEHDWLPHGRSTNDNLRVPLIVRFPPGVVRPPLRVPSVVSTIDVLPTVLARFESEASRRFLEQAEGQDLLGGAPLRGWALGQRTTRRRAGWERGDEFALVTDRFKLVRRPGGEDELYDLVGDPGERIDVSAQQAETKAGLRRTLGEVLRRRAAAGAADGGTAAEESGAPDEHIEALRSLGYVDD